MTDAIIPTAKSKNAVETIRVKRDETGLRLDRWFKIHFPDVGHGYLQKMLRSGQVRVDSKRVEANFRVESGQEIRVPKVAREKPGAGKGGEGAGSFPGPEHTYSANGAAAGPKEAPAREAREEVKYGPG